MFWYKIFNNRSLSPDGDAGADDKKDDTKADDKAVDDEVELDFNGTKTKLAKAKIVEHLNTAAGSTQILRKLYDAGVIDEAGNPKVKKEEKPDDKSDDEKSEERVAKLEADLEKMRHEQNVDKFAKKLNELLDLSAQSHDLTKADEDIASDIREVVLAKFHSNPQLDIKQLYKEQVDKKMKFMKKYESKLKDTNDSEGGSGTFTLDKPIDSKGLREGTARKAAQKLLEGAFKIG